MAGEPILPVTSSGILSHVITTPAGAVATGTTYPLVDVVATQRAGGVARVMILSREYSATHDVAFNVSGASPATARIHRIEHASLRATNDVVADEVRIQTQVVTLAGPLVITVQPHSLVRIDFE
jgi:hypothetical protein